MQVKDVPALEEDKEITPTNKDLCKKCKCNK